MKLSILDRNIQGTEYYTKTHFSKIRPTLNSLEIDILCLQEGQEFRHEKERLVNFKDFHNIFSKGNEDGVVVISSRFPIIEYGELDPRSDKGQDMGCVLRAKIKIGRKIIKIYNCHLSIDGVGPKERLQILREIFIDSQSHKGGIIICGDMNTTIPAKGINRRMVQFFHRESGASMITDKKYGSRDERYMVEYMANKYGFQDILDIQKSTRCVDLFHIHRELFKLKLDWFFVNKEIEIESYTLSDKYISDHKSVYVNCQI